MAFTSPNRTWVVGETVTAAIMNQYVRDQLDSIGRLGKYDFFMEPTAGYQVANIIDVAWAECNNQAISRTTYSDFDTKLAALTPTRPFGAGDGSTTVNVPDYFGRAPYGMGSHSDVNAFALADGVAAANRTPKHNGTLTGAPALGSLVVTGAPSIGSLAATHNLTLPSHTHPAANQSGGTGAGAGGGNFVDILNTGAPNTLPAIVGGVTVTGAPALGSLAVGGAPGIGTLAAGPGGTRPVDTPSYQVGGIWVVKVKK